jgi:hypothetical protein
MPSENHTAVEGQGPPVNQNPMGIKAKALLFLKYAASTFLSFFTFLKSVFKSVPTIFASVAPGIIRKIKSPIGLIISLIMLWLSGVFRALGLTGLWAGRTSLDFMFLVAMVAICVVTSGSNDQSIGRTGCYTIVVVTICIGIIGGHFFLRAITEETILIFGLVALGVLSYFIPPASPYGAFVMGLCVCVLSHRLYGRYQLEDFRTRNHLEPLGHLGVHELEMEKLRLQLQIQQQAAAIPEAAN